MAPVAAPPSNAAGSSDVLIVGAGPTGLTLACQLLARGVRCRIIDKLPGPDLKSRALVVQTRTLELLAKMGLADALVSAGQRGVRGTMYVDKQKIVSLELSDPTLAFDTAFPFALFVSEADTERVLTEHLTALGGRIERGTELTEFSQNDAGVTAELRGPAGNETVQCQYIAGCDGAHSRVRHDAGITFKGAPYEQDFVLADVEIDTPLSHDEAHIHVPERGMFVALPMPGARRWRLIAAGHDLHSDDPPRDPTLAEIQELADRDGAAPLRLSNPTWLARFRLHHRGADRYRVGRAFVAGDAAHIHSPAGGQGMNTGIQDAYNLGWKLALVLHNVAAPHLLDSYHEERWPVGRDLLRFTDRIFALGATQSSMALVARRRLAPRVLRFVTATAERRSFLFRFISELSINYRRSHIVGEDFGDDAWRHGPLAGDRAPDGPAVLGETGAPTTLHTALSGLPFQVIFFAGDRTTAEVLREVGEPHSRHVIAHVVTRKPDTAPRVLIDPDGKLHQRYGVSDAATYLIRPDGYIGYRAPRIESIRVAANVLRG